MTKEIALAISIWIIVIPFIVGFLNYRRLNKDSRWIFYLVIIAMPPQLLSFKIREAPDWLNAIYNIYTPIEFFILFVIFYTKYETAEYKLILRLSAALYPVIMLSVFICDGITDSFLNLLACLNNLIYIVWISLFLKEQYHVQNSGMERTNPFAWYLLALLIYATGSVIVLALYHYIRVKDTDAGGLWIIHTICNTMLYILFAVGLSLPKQMTHEPESKQ